MSDIYTIDLLIKALNSNRENVAIWAAYHLLSLDDDLLKNYLPGFLKSQFVDIQEAAVARISAGEMEDFTPEVLKLFRESEGQLKYSASNALGILPNDLTKRLLTQWFEQVVQGGQATRLELDNAVYSLLKSDISNFQKVLDCLAELQNESIKSSILLYNLLSFAEESKSLEVVFDYYFLLRDLHSDVDLTYRFLDYFDQIELINWMADNISYGYSIQSIYEQCYALLGENFPVEEKEQLENLNRIFLNSKEVAALEIFEVDLFFNSIFKWLEALSQRYAGDERIQYYLALSGSFCRNSGQFFKSIPKIIEFEYFVLLSLPLQILAENSLNKWLNSPTAHLEDIAKYYNSTLLTGENREKILSLFFSNKAAWSEEQVKIHHATSPIEKGNSKNEILWAFYRDQYLGYDVNWPVIFPNPSYSFKLSEGLAKIYLCNFDLYVSQRNNIAVDYALKLFQLSPEKPVTDVLVRHFDYLVQSHSELLFQTLELLPDPRYIELLCSKYRTDEVEIAQLISFMCEIFEIAVPKKVADDLALDRENQNLNWKKRVRLNCQVCNHTFQYPVEVVFVDEKSVQQKLQLTNDMIWVPQTFSCKNCSSKIEFKLTSYQLEELTQQSVVDQLLKNSPNHKYTKLRQKIVPIEFPQLDQVTYNPDQFNDLVIKKEKDTNIDRGYLTHLYIKQARILKSMMQWQLCLDVLKKSDPMENLRPEWFFLKGLCCFKLSLWKEARDHFSWLVKNISKPEGVEGSYWEQARYFLSEMDSEKSRRSRFTIIEGKKC